MALSPTQHGTELLVSGLSVQQCLQRSRAHGDWISSRRYFQQKIARDCYARVNVVHPGYVLSCFHWWSHVVVTKVVVPKVVVPLGKSHWAIGVLRDRRDPDPLRLGLSRSHGKILLAAMVKHMHSAPIPLPE
jgi:hypothetical protein